MLDAADDADPTDLEFIAIALRRLDPGRVRLIVGSRGDVPALSEALAGYSTHQAAPAATVPEQTRTGERIFELAAAFVASDGTSDKPEELAAFLALDAQLRARLHDQRVEELARCNEWSLHLGAIPYHQEHGSGLSDEAKTAYYAAIDYCIDMAFYDAGLELTARMLRLIDPATDPSAYYVVQAQRCQCLTQLERSDETEPIYYELLGRTEDPARHMSIYYSLAMLYTRVYEPDRKDHHKAMAHVNTAVAIATQLTDPEDQAFNTVFMRNGKALVEMHLGRLDESLRLVNEGIDRLNRQLPPGKHRLHRSVLNHNRANVYAALGRTDEALADFNHVIEIDPHYAEYHFDRGNMLYKLGRHGEALADYETAIGLDGPFPELYYNRGDLLSALGDVDGAMADFRYVLDLEPDYVEATISLASVLLDAGQPDQAAAQVTAALELSPDEARLHCTLGLALLDLDDCPAATAAFNRALDLDQDLVVALVNRAVAAFQQGSYQEAIADLTAALEASPASPDLLYNRGLARAAAGQNEGAIADYTLALDDAAADRTELLYRRGLCHLALGRTDQAHADIAAHLALGDSLHADEIGALMDGVTVS
jgi:tetratricopeptide (TPR) repeat protein